MNMQEGTVLLTKMSWDVYHSGEQICLLLCEESNHLSGDLH